MSGAQKGGLVAGIWLIAIGSVFLIQQALDLSWTRAWPLFLIMAGVGSGASALIGLAGRRISPLAIAWALVWPVLLVVVGTLLLLDFAGLVEFDTFDVLARWWPVILIVIGLLVLAGAFWPRGRGVEDRISVPVGDAASGEVVLKFGAGRLDVGRGSPGILANGTFEGGVLRRDPGPGRVELEADVSQVFSFGDQLHWQVGLAPDVPLSLRLEGGASKSVLDLAELQVTSLVVKTGASDTRIVLPRDTPACDVRIDAGAAQVVVEIPAGVAARIRSQVGLGSTNVDLARFPRTPDGWESADFATAERRAEIRVAGGLGSVRIS